MEDSPTPRFGDKLVRLVPSGITLLFVIFLVAGARHYEKFPVKPQPCGMRTLTGLPCVTCGGTRAMRALAQGDVRSAIAFNPLVIAAILAVIAWFGVRLWQVARGRTPGKMSKIPVRWAVGVGLILGAANWIYLVFRLPE